MNNDPAYDVGRAEWPQKPDEFGSRTSDRDEWERVRERVAEVCSLPKDEQASRIAQLRMSDDPMDRRAADLAALNDAAGDFLERPAASAASSPAVPLYRSGDELGPYRVLSLLGVGGMGQVYLAEDTRLLREVAIKVVGSDAALLREARMAARLQHDRIVAIYDVIEANGRLHIVMERLHGSTLASLGPSATADDAARYITQVLAAVSHAHRETVIHCDLKPANVFVLADGSIKVLDFGLARFESHAGQGSSLGIAGTPRFLAPERLLGAPPSPSTDVYSVGVILHDLLTDGASTRRSTPALQTMVRNRRAALLRVAAEAMSPDPTDRFVSAEAMQVAVEEAASSGRRSMRFVVAAAALVVAMAGASLYLSLPRRPSERPVIAVELSAIGADPLASHIAAAMEQLVVRSLANSRDLVIVRQTSATSAQRHELGATHELSGIVRRTSDAIDLTIGLATAADDRLLGSRSARAAVSDPRGLSQALLGVVADLLQRAGIEIAGTGATTDDIAHSLSVNGQAFEEYAQAREYLRTPEVAGNVDHAIGLLGRALERDSAFVLAHASLAEAYWQKYQATRDGAWTDRARAAALDALRLNPDEPAVRLTLALIYRGMGRLEEALGEVTKAIELEPTGDDMYRLRGRVQAELGRLDQALIDLETARTLRPGYWDNHRSTGLVLYEAGRYNLAVPHFQRVTELRPNNASAFQILGTALHQAGRVPEALHAYQRALQIAPSANTYSNIAKLHYDGGRFEQARDAYQQSLRIQPKEALTHRNLGDTFLRLGQKSQAREAYEQAIALAAEALQVNPANVDALSLQAICHAKVGRASEAQRSANQVLANARLSPIIRYRAALALILSNAREQGIVEVVRALDEGFSKSEATSDGDLAAVASDQRIVAALEGGAAR